MKTDSVFWPVSRPLLILCGALILLMLLGSAWVWSQLPDDARIPVHWNIQGQPDRYSGKPEGLLLLPLITLAVTVLMLIIPRFEPRREHFRLSQKSYRIIIGGIVVVMCGLHCGLLLAALGKPVDIGRFVPSAVGLLFIVIGNRMGKIRSNFFLGVRTPWTLSSELAWNKTHRFTGWLFVLLGIGLIISATLFSGLATFIVLISGCVFIVGGSAVYSYLIWKKDPERSPKA